MGDMQSEYMDDDGMTAYTSNRSQDEAFADILIDYATHTNGAGVSKPRDFKSRSTWMLEKLGIEKYDAVTSLDKMIFSIADVIKDAKLEWKTITLDRIKTITKLVVVRELNMIDSRKDARQYRIANPEIDEVSDFDGNMSVVKSIAGSYSGSRGSPSPAKRAA